MGESSWVVPVSLPSFLLWLAMVAAFVMAGWVLLDVWDRFRVWFPQWRQHRRDAHRVWVRGQAERDRRIAARCGR